MLSAFDGRVFQIFAKALCIPVMVLAVKEQTPVHTIITSVYTGLSQDNKYCLPLCHLSASIAKAYLAFIRQ